MDYKLTRLAPTPSGFLHLGNIVSFALTAFLARRSGAAILLRIDDLDRERVQREYVADIFETLRFMEIPYDRGPRDVAEFERGYSQLHRLPLYRDALSRLRSADAVFGCSCSRAEVMRGSTDGGYFGTCRGLGLSLDGEVSWRLRTSMPPPIVAPLPTVAPLTTAAPLTTVAPLPAEMRDFVVRKKDGFPAYQLSSVVDDLHYGVDLIVRGQDLWASTVAQQYLSYSLDAEAFREIHFYHHPLLTEASGEKLSKSAGATSIQYLRRQGLAAAEIYGLIARRFLGDAAASGTDPSDGATSATAFAAAAAAAADVRDWAGLAELVLMRASRLQR